VEIIKREFTFELSGFEGRSGCPSPIRALAAAPITCQEHHSPDSDAATVPGGLLAAGGPGKGVGGGRDERALSRPHQRCHRVALLIVDQLGFGPVEIDTEYGPGFNW